MKGNRTMNKSREAGRVDVKKLVDRGMSRCLFGEWPRRALLKLGHSDYEGGVILLAATGRSRSQK